MPTATQIKLEHAKPNKLFYVVANIIIFRSQDQRCLLLKRSDRETAHPGKYGVIGGKLEWSDLDIHHPTRINDQVLDYEQAIESLLRREAVEEAGITFAGPLHYINSLAYIRPDGIPSILIKFAALYDSGAIKLDTTSFSDFTWANAAEALQLPCIDGIAGEVEQTIQIYKYINIT